MDIEKLTLVMDTLTKVGEDASTLALVWMVASYVLPFIMGLVVITLIYKAVRAIIRATVLTNADTALVLALYPLTTNFPSSHPRESDLKPAREAIRKIVEEHYA